ncbi:phosphate signaling complex protein PhoU [uncultured Methanomethylovorans sp.]|uniref:phosphate signaling complex protein PhoU n=1 Tax=uncultured Methanomethylovorans sp. TaxID=183759 RepID=UPI002AA82DDD|nr:phosphate signaling complex protein PhoU [uncultured Methanomethylovorans sp.]
MSREKYHNSLDLLKINVLEMMQVSLDMLRGATESLTNLDTNLARETIKKDDIVDEKEIKVEKCVSHLIALQQPMASDMRLITASLTMAIDLERLSDLACNIAWTSTDIKGEPERNKVLLSGICKMSEITEKMLQGTMIAFKDSDPELAKEVARGDDVLDKLFFDTEKEFIEMMIKDHSIITDASHLLFVLRYLERIGDHICNICQSIVYLVTGERLILN